MPTQREDENPAAVESTCERQQLCQTCQRINIENISQVGGLLLHYDLNELQTCSEACPICRLAFRGLQRTIEEGTEVSVASEDQSYDWRHSSNWHRYQIAATWLRSQGEEAVALELFSTNFHWSRPEVPLYRIGIITVESLQVRTDAIDPAADLGVPSARKLSSHTGSDDSMRTAKAWLKQCIHSHPKCQSTSPPSSSPTKPPSRPTRLIQCRSDNTLRLINGSTVPGPYLALSYQWGREPPIWRTETHNLSLRQHPSGFSLALLPATLRDAIHVAHNLAIPHLWIDSLCIIQDDPADWLREAARMGDVYAHAHLTLAADASPSSVAGLFNQRSRSHVDQLRAYADSHAISSVLSDGRASTLHLLAGSYLPPQWLSVVEESLLSRRGWCCQERLLSSRLLHFADSQLFWECREDQPRAEDGFVSSDLPVRPPGIRDWRVGFRPAVVSTGMRFNPPEKFGFPALEPVVRHLLGLWYGAVVAAVYSRARLTIARDKLIAIAGLARIIHEIRPMRYLAGIWEEGFLFGLCWYRAGREAGKAAEYRAPSWSWASQDSPVDFKWLAVPADVSSMRYASVEDVYVECQGGDQFSLVRNAWVKVRAKAIMGKLSVSSGMESEGTDETDRGIQKLVLENEIECDAYLDNPMDRPVDVLVLLLMAPSMHLRFLLLQPRVNDDGYVRVGIADLRLRSKGVVERFDHIPHNLFVVY